MTAAAYAGFSLSTMLNVQGPFQLMVFCSCIKEVVKTRVVSAILRGTATTSTKARCEWDSRSPIVLDTVEVMTPTQAGIHAVSRIFIEEVPKPGSGLDLDKKSCMKAKYNGTLINCFILLLRVLLIFLCAAAFFCSFAHGK